MTLLSVQGRAFLFNSCTVLYWAGAYRGYTLHSTYKCKNGATHITPYCKYIDQFLTMDGRFQPRLEGGGDICKYVDCKCTFIISYYKLGFTVYYKM